MSYASMGDVKNAIIIQKDIICKADSSTRERRKIFGQWEADFDTYADYISNLARYYNLNHQYDSAIIYEKKSLDIKLKYKPIENNLAYSYTIDTLKSSTTRRYLEGNGGGASKHLSGFFSLKIASLIPLPHAT